MTKQFDKIFQFFNFCPIFNFSPFFQFCPTLNFVQFSIFVQCFSFVQFSFLVQFSVWSIFQIFVQFSNLSNFDNFVSRGRLKLSILFFYFLFFWQFYFFFLRSMKMNAVSSKNVIVRWNRGHKRSKSRSTSTIFDVNLELFVPVIPLT